MIGSGSDFGSGETQAGSETLAVCALFACLSTWYIFFCMGKKGLDSKKKYWNMTVGLFKKRYKKPNFKYNLPLLIY